MLLLRDRFSRALVGTLCLLLAAHSIFAHRAVGVTLVELVAGVALLALAAFAQRPRSEVDR
jgi:hypothetical protein